MSRPDWGMKRICPTCSARFYDMRKQPIVCPKCLNSFDPELFVKKRRGRPPMTETKAAVLPVELEDPLDIDDLEGELEVLDESDDILEDTSDFGDDDAVVPTHIPTDD